MRLASMKTQATNDVIRPCPFNGVASVNKPAQCRNGSKSNLWGLRGYLSHPSVEPLVLEDLLSFLLGIEDRKAAYITDVLQDSNCGRGRSRLLNERSYGSKKQ